MKHIDLVSKALPARAQEEETKSVLSVLVNYPIFGYGGLGDIVLAAYQQAAGIVTNCCTKEAAA